MLDKFPQDLLLIINIYHLKETRELGVWSVFEILDIFGNYFSVKYERRRTGGSPVDDEVSLLIAHIRYHEDAIRLRIWEFQRRFLAFDIEC